ncbi:MAG: YebC/PmpR family DNA-binding transcriptional regulator [Desulfosalsimonas sp.]
MAGHSKWANIKHKKSAEDAKRGKIFTRLVKEIIVAARMGGGDPEANPRLRTVLEKAKQNNLPKDNIERAIKKGTGELEGVNYEETAYEGYGPGGAAVYIESLSDNKNRTVADIRHIFSKHGGSMGENGCVSWVFDKKGWIPVKKSDATEETLMETAIEAGAEDIRDEDDIFEIITPPQAFEDVKDALREAGVPFEGEEVTMLPQTTISLKGADAEKMLKLMNALDDSDDVQRVHTNADIPQEIIEAAG